MIDLSPPYYQVTVATREDEEGPEREKVMVFRDHEDTSLFHVLPPAPHLVIRDDKPTFKLIMYRFPAELAEQGSAGGGMALFEVEAGLSQPQLDAVARQVSVLSGVSDARAIPVVFRGGTVRTIVAQSDDEDRMIETLMEARPAPPLPPYTSAFALSLTPAGASLMRQAAEGDELPVGVIYEFRFDGLLPALNARVKMDYDRTYQRFAASIGFEYSAVRVELGAELAWLIENDIIEVEITSFTSGEDRAQQEQQVMALVQARLEQDFFRSSMPRKQKATNGLSNLLTALFGGEGEPDASSAMFVLKAKYELEVELRTFEQHFDRRAAQELTHVSTGFLWGMHAGQDPDVTLMDLGSDFFKRLELTVIGAFNFEAMPDLQQVAVHIEHPLRGDTFVFARDGDERFSFNVPLSEDDGGEYQWRATFSFDPLQGNGPASIEVGPFTTTDRILAVSSQLLDYRRVTLLVIGAFEEVARYRLSLRVPGPDGEVNQAKASLVLDADTPERVFTARLPRGEERPNVLVRVEAELQDGTRIPAEERAVSGNVFVVTPRDIVSLRRVRVLAAANWELVSQILIDLRYDQGEEPQERSFAFKADTASTVEWSFVKSAPAATRYKYHSIVVLQDGTVVEQDWIETDESSIVIGALPEVGEQLRVIAVGDFGDTLGLQVDVWPLLGDDSDGDKQSAFLHEGQVEEKLRLPTTDAGLRYRYEVWRITADGRTKIDGKTSNTEVLVVIAEAPG